MCPANETADDELPRDFTRPPRPGLVLLWSARTPRCTAFSFGARTLDIGRDARCDIVLPEDDSAASRRHAEISFETATRELRVRDTGSRNGTFVDGVRVTDLTITLPPATAFSLDQSHSPTQAARRPAPSSKDAPRLPVIRIGGAVFIAHPDLERFRSPSATDHRLPAVAEDAGSVTGPALRSVYALVRDAAARDRTLAIYGESGTGKERVARLFHSSGSRAKGPFVAVNCARFEPGTANVEIFGAARGGYTGAVTAREGAFEQADGGVLFLDEVADLDAAVQTKLLRVLEDGIVEPLGGKPKRVDVAVCCATNRDLHTLADEGKFRKDLLIRLAQLDVRIPPLRERPEDIPLLLELFRKRVVGAPAFTTRFVEDCVRAEWPLNVRELEIAVDRAASAALRQNRSSIYFPSQETEEQRPSLPMPDEPPPVDFEAVLRTRSEKTRQSIRGSLIVHHGDVDKVMEALNVSRSAVFAEKKRMREEAEAAGSKGSDDDP